MNTLFPAASQPAPLVCEKACDANDDGTLSLGDAVKILYYLFYSQADPIPAPGTVCGIDPTPDLLSCDMSSCQDCYETSLLNTFPGVPIGQRVVQDMVALSSCNSLMVGKIENGTVPYGGYVWTVDMHGNTHSMNGPHPNFDFYSATEVALGGAIVAGLEFNGGQFAHARMLDAAGQEIWSFTGLEPNTHVADVIITAAGEVLLLEQTWDTISHLPDPWVRMRLRWLNLTNGQELDKVLVPTKVVGNAMIELTNEDLIIVGKHAPPLGSAHMRVAPDGSIVWQQLNPQVGVTDEFHDITAVPGYGFAVTHKTGSDSLLELYAIDGQLLWDEEMPPVTQSGTTSVPRMKYVHFEPNDGSIVVVGNYQSAPHISKFDVFGSFIWSEVYPEIWSNVHGNNNYVPVFDRSPNGQAYLIGGYMTGSLMSPSDTNFFIKTNSSGVVVP